MELTSKVICGENGCRGSDAPIVAQLSMEPDQQENKLVLRLKLSVSSSIQVFQAYVNGELISSGKKFAPSEA